MIKVGDKVSWTKEWFINGSDVIHLVRKSADDDHIVIVCSCDHFPPEYLQKHDNEKAITCEHCLDGLANM